MLKIDKKVFSVITGMFLASTLVSCSAEKNNEVLFNSINATAVYYDGGSAIIVPVFSYFDYNSGLVRINVDSKGNYAVYNSSDLTIFYNDNELSSYDKALNFASAVSNEVYLYEDIIKGNQTSLVVDGKVKTK